MGETHDLSNLAGPSEPSDAERSEWPQATADYVAWLEQAQPPAVTDEQIERSVAFMKRWKFDWGDEYMADFARQFLSAALQGEGK